MFFTTGLEHGRRQRGDGQRQTQCEHQHTGQDGGGIRARLVDDSEQAQAEPRDDRTEAHRQARPDALSQTSGAGRQEQHHDRQRHERRPGGQG